MGPSGPVSGRARAATVRPDDGEHSRTRRRGPWRGWSRWPSLEPRPRPGRASGRHLRHQPGDPGPDRDRRDALPGDRRRRSSCARFWRPVASSSAPSGDDDRGAPVCLVVVIGTPVDEFLGPSMTIFEKAVDQIAPYLRDGGAGRHAQHGLPGDDRLRRPAPAPLRGCTVDVAFCPERIAEGHALEELHTLPQIIGADTDRAAERAAQLFGVLAAKTIRTTDQGSRAGEAVHEHLAVHEVRGRQPVLHDRRPGRRGLHERSCGRSARTTRGRPTCPGPASPPVRACSRTPCSSPPSPPTISRSARRRCRSTRGCRPTSCRRSSGATAAGRQDHRDPGHGLQGRVRRHPGVAELQAPQAPVVGGRPRASAPTRTSIDDRLVPLEQVLAESDVLVLGAPHRAYRGLRDRRQGRRRRVGRAWAPGSGSDRGDDASRRGLRLDPVLAMIGLLAGGAVVSVISEVKICCRPSHAVGHRPRGLRRGSEPPPGDRYTVCPRAAPRSVHQRLRAYPDRLSVPATPGAAVRPARGHSDAGPGGHLGDLPGADPGDPPAHGVRAIWRHRRPRPRGRAPAGCGGLQPHGRCRRDRERERLGGRADRGDAARPVERHLDRCRRRPLAQVDAGCVRTRSDRRPRDATTRRAGRRRDRGALVRRLAHRMAGLAGRPALGGGLLRRGALRREPGTHASVRRAWLSGRGDGRRRAWSPPHSLP